MPITKTGLNAGAAAFVVGLGIALANGAGAAGATPDSPDSADTSSTSATADSTGDEDSSGSSSTADPQGVDSRGTSKLSPSETARRDKGDKGTEPDGVTETERESDTERASPADDGADEVSDDGADDNRVIDATASGEDETSDTAASTADLAEVPNGTSEEIDTAAAPTAVGTTEPARTSLHTLDANAANTNGAWLHNLFAGLGEWFRRTFFNQHPVAAPIQHAQLRNGRIVGTVGGADPEGDRLVHRLITGPEHGTVTVGADGSYVYVPDVEFARQGGTDTFYVRVVDSGFHLHLRDVFGLGDATTARAALNTSEVASDDTVPAGPRNIVPITVAIDADPSATADPATPFGGTFTVTNLSSKPIVFAGYDSDPGTDALLDGPTHGTQLQPGEYVQFTIERRVSRTGDSVRAVFYSRATHATVAVLMLFTPQGTGATAPGSSCKVTGSGVDCSTYKSPHGPWYWGTPEIAILDEPDTHIFVFEDDPQKQAEVLNMLCGSTVVATCTVNTQNVVRTNSTEVQIGDEIQNLTDDVMTVNKQLTYTNTTLSNITLTADVRKRFDDDITAMISEAYGDTWTDSAAFENNIEVVLQPHSTATVWASAPVYRVKAFVMIQMGNTRWTIGEVAFDTPVSPEAGATATWTIATN